MRCLISCNVMSVSFILVASGHLCTVKEDLQTSSAESVYGQTLHIPGDFISDSTRSWALSSDQPAL